jgi:hypothetical protein
MYSQSLIADHFACLIKQATLTPPTTWRTNNHGVTS